MSARNFVKVLFTLTISNKVETLTEMLDVLEALTDQRVSDLPLFLKDIRQGLILSDERRHLGEKTEPQRTLTISIGIDISSHHRLRVHVSSPIP